MCPTIVSGKSLLGTRRFVAIGQVFPKSLVTVSDVFAKDNSVQFSPCFYIGEYRWPSSELSKQRRYRITRLQDLKWSIQKKRLLKVIGWLGRKVYTPLANLP